MRCKTVKFLWFLLQIETEIHMEKIYSVYHDFMSNYSNAGITNETVLWFITCVCKWEVIVTVGHFVVLYHLSLPTYSSIIRKNDAYEIVSESLYEIQYTNNRFWYDAWYSLLTFVNKQTFPRKMSFLIGCYYDKWLFTCLGLRRISVVVQSSCLVPFIFWIICGKAVLLLLFHDQTW